MERLPSPMIRFVVLIAMIVSSAVVGSAQVRTKKPDRGVYRPPVVGEPNQQANQKPDASRTKNVSRKVNPTTRKPKSATASVKASATATSKNDQGVKPKWGAPLVDTEIIEFDESGKPLTKEPVRAASHHQAADSQSPSVAAGLQVVAHDQVRLQPVRAPLRDPSTQSTHASRRVRRADSDKVSSRPPVPSGPRFNPGPSPKPRTARQGPGPGAVRGDHRVVGGEVILNEPSIHHQQASGHHQQASGDVIYHDTIDPGTGLAAPVYADSHGDAVASCDALYDGGCDSIGGGHLFHSLGSNATLSLSPERWFWTAELLLMNRRGTRVPALVTTGSDADRETAGEIGQPETQILNGNGVILKDVTAGGRLTIGTWLDDYQDRSFVVRAWFAGEEDHSFSTNQTINNVIARPFFNVSDGQAAEQDTQIIAFPNFADGSITVSGDSNVHGTDLSVRQGWWDHFGLSVDLLYGYQYMHVDESLGISSFSTALEDNTNPIGSTIAVNDSFATENTFHGGQLGMTTLYREGCWSLRTLTKVGFGSLRRESTILGSTVTTVDGVEAVDDTGLLVQETNRGNGEDHTFGWVPEFDVALGWHRYPSMDVTIGYHVIAMTDAIQPGGLIDTNLNLADNPTGSLSPVRGFDTRTFYVQGIHFGLAYIY